MQTAWTITFVFFVNKDPKVKPKTIKVKAFVNKINNESLVN